MPGPSQLQPAPTSIGVYLQWARAQKGLELRELEERTKIRAKYLQALETEDWDVIPSSAYARGFLATYARELDVDADALVDEYRRQVETEEPTANLSAYGEPVLEVRRRVGAAGPSRASLVLALLVVLVLVGVGAWLLSRSGSDSNSGSTGGRGGHGSAAQGLAAPAGGSAVPLKIHTRTGMRVCLLGAGGVPLVDGQTLPSGAREGPFDAAKYRLDVNTGGTLKLTIGSALRRLEPKGPASYRIAGTRVTAIPYKGPACP